MPADGTRYSVCDSFRSKTTVRLLHHAFPLAHTADRHGHTLPLAERVALGGLTYTTKAMCDDSTTAQ